MPEPAASARSAGVFVVLRAATGGTASANETYAAVPRSEWRVAQQL
jgi:hypothetical protein